jgi:hypothetical protein
MAWFLRAGFSGRVFVVLGSGGFFCVPKDFRIWAPKGNWSSVGRSFLILRAGFCDWAFVVDAPMAWFLRLRFSGWAFADGFLWCLDPVGFDFLFYFEVKFLVMLFLPNSIMGFLNGLHFFSQSFSHFFSQSLSHFFSPGRSLGSAGKRLVTVWAGKASFELPVRADKGDRQ